MDDFRKNFNKERIVYWWKPPAYFCLNCSLPFHLQASHSNIARIRHSILLIQIRRTCLWTKTKIGSIVALNFSENQRWENKVVGRMSVWFSHVSNVFVIIFVFLFFFVCFISQKKCVFFHLNLIIFLIKLNKNIQKNPSYSWTTYMYN